MIPKRSELVTRYGAIDFSNNPPWPGESKEMVLLPVLLPLQMYLLTFMDNGHTYPTTKIYVNRDMAQPLNHAFINVVQRGHAAKIHQFGGCFNIRKVRGGTEISSHAYGLAIDLNPRENPLGSTPTLESMHPELVKCFTDVGFVWGGHFKNRLDPQHFQWLIED